MGARGRLPGGSAGGPTRHRPSGMCVEAKCPRAIGTGLAHHIADLIRSLSDLAVVTPHSPVAR